MLRDKSQELPSSFSPQWMLNRGGAGAGGTDAAAAGSKQQAPSVSPAAGRESKWAADRWGPTEKEAESKWGHDPFDRPRWTAEDEGERGLGGGRLPRDTGRWKAGGEGWGNQGQSAFPAAADRADRWDRAERAERVELPARDPPAAARSRWRPDEKQDKWGTRGDASTWRALPGEGGTAFRAGGRGAGLDRDDRYGDRPDRGVGRPREDGGFAPSRLSDERVAGKGRGFGGYGRGRPAGGAVAPGASPYDRDWDRRDLDDGPVGRSNLTRNPSLGDSRAGRGRYKPKTYSIDHLEDIRILMQAKRGSELPLPQGLSPDELGEIWKGFVYDEPSTDSGTAAARTSSEAAGLAATRSSSDAAALAGTRSNADTAAAAGATAAAAEAPAAAHTATAAAPQPALAPAAAAPPPAAAEAPVAAAAAAGVAPAPAAAAAAQPSLQSQLPPGMVLQALELDQWLYQDPKGDQQGPFARTDILDWAEQGFFNDTLPIRSALPGQEAVWTTLQHMVTVWAQMARRYQPQEAAAEHALATDFNLAQLGPDQGMLRVEAWLQQQPDQQQQQQPPAAVQDPHQPPQQQQPHPGFPYATGPQLPPHSLPHTFGGPGHTFLGAPGPLPHLTPDAAAAAAAAAGAPGPVAAAFPHQPLFGAQHLAPGGAPPPAAAAAAAGHLLPPVGANALGQHPLQQHDFGAAAAVPATQQPAPQQRTLFGTPLEPSPVPAPAAAAAAAGAPEPFPATGSKMLEMLFSRGARMQLQQQQAAAPPASQPPAAAAAEPALQDSSSWETVPTKAAKQQERAAAQHLRQQEQEAAQQQWQQRHQPPPAAAAEEQEESVPSGPVQMPLFAQQQQQQQRSEPPKVSPWAAAAAPAAAPTHAKSLREIQEEEQARAAAEEAARAEAAAATAPPGPGPAAAAAAAWGGLRPGVAPSNAGPPGWGPPPAAALGQPPAAALARAGSSGSNAQAGPGGPVGADDLPAAVKKATLGDVLKARLGTAGPAGSNASSNSMGAAAAAAGPWGAAATQRPAVNLQHIMQQEQTDREETLADMEGGTSQDDGLEDIIAALSRHNSSRQQQQRQPPAAAAVANDDGLFWDYTGAASAAPPAAPEPAPAAAAAPAVNAWATPPAAVAAAAAARGAGAPAAAAPPPVAGPWARAANSNAIKAPPPGAAAAAAAAPAAAAAAAGRNAALPRRAGAAARPLHADAVAAPRGAAAAAAAPSSTATTAFGNGPAAAAAGGSSETGGLFMGGLDISAGFAAWCRAQMLALNGNEDMTMVEFLMGLDSNSEIAENCQAVWPNKLGVSSFVAEFVKRKLADKNQRKPGGKKKKGATTAVAAQVAPHGGVNAAAVGMVHAGPATDTWSKIPKKPGTKKKAKGAKLDPGMLGFTTKLDLNVLADDDDE